MKKPRLQLRILILTTILISSIPNANAQLAGGTYTIGPSGTYANFTAAVAALGGGVSGSVVFNVAAGTYNEKISISYVTGASAINTITFQSASGDSTSVTLQGASTSSADGTVVLNGAYYIKFKKMTIKTTSTSGSYRTVFNFRSNANYNEISNCIIQGSYYNSSYASAIYSYGFLNEYNLIDNNIIKDCYAGIYWRGVSQTVLAQDNLFSDNQISNYYSYGMYLYYHNAVQVIGNTITGSASYGMYLRYCDNDCKFSKNNIKNTGSRGMYLVNCDGTWSNRIEISNNFISGAITYAIYDQNSRYHDYYYNSINVNNSSYGFYFNNSSSTTYHYHNIKNNNFVNTGTGYAAYICNNSHLTSADYNNYYSPTGDFVYWVGARTNLAALKAAYSNTNQHSISADPGFASPSDLHINSIDLNGAAIPVSTVTVDFDGETRDATTPDIGADEFPVPTNDLAVVEWLAPLTVITPPQTSSVTIVVKNIGSAAQSNVPVKYSIDQGATIISGIIAGPILSGDTAHYTFATQATIPNMGMYYCEAIVAQTGDANGSNDTLIYPLSACGNIAGTFTIGPDSGYFASCNDALSMMNSCSGINGAVVFRVHPGTYNESLYISEITGASATNTITFESYTGDSTSVILTSSNNYTVMLYGADYVRFKKMTIATSSTGIAQVIHFDNGANYNEFSNNVIIGRAVTTNSTLYSTIYNPSGTPLDENNVIENNVIKNGSAGIYFYGASSTSLESGNIIEGNDISGYYYYGIYAYDQNAIKINYNNIHDGIPANSYYHIYMKYCDNDFEVVGNRIDFQYGYGIYMYDCYGTSSNRPLIANNMISQHTQDSTAVGIRCYHPKYTDVYNNSVNITSNYNSTTDNTCLYLYNYSSAYLNMKNNNFVNTGSGYAAYVNNHNCLTSADYNNYYTTGTNYVRWGGTISNLAALKATDATRNVNSVSLDPDYVSNTDLHIAPNLDANNKGTSLTLITDDIDGEIRDATNPDIGADEFSPPPNDAGVVAINEPLNQAGAGILAVKVSIKNYGTIALTSATIKWQVNGGTISSYSWAGNLAPGLTTGNITLGNDTFPVGVSHIKAWSESPNGVVDGSAVNDTAISIVNLVNIKVYTIGGISPDFIDFTSAITHLQDSGVVVPTVFIVAPGTYDEQITIPEILGASAANTITFKSSTGINTDVMIQPTTSTTATWVVQLNGADYITFKILSFKATGSLTRVVEVTGGATHNTFEGCIIDQSTASAYYCVYDNSTLNHYNTYRNNKIIGGGSGLYIRGSGSTSWEKGTVVEGNEISGFYNRGINSYYTDSTQIIGNYIHGNIGSFAYGIDCHYTMNGYRISNNKIEITSTSSSQCHGLHDDYGNYYSYNTYPTGYGLVANNFVTITGGTGTHYGLHSYYSKGTEYYYNSINITGGSTSARCLYQSNTNNNIVFQTFKNNIFSNTGGGYAAYFNAHTMVTSDYNNFYSNGSYLTFWYQNMANLSAHKSASSMDSNSLSINPGFLSTTDLHINNANLDGNAIPIPAVTIDIDGEPRNTITPDIGADEFMLLGDDACIFSLNEPIAPCPGTTSNVKVELKNFGIDTLFSANIHWMVNTQLKDSVIFNNIILPGASTIVTLDTLTFYQGILYNITFWTTLPNGVVDLRPSNDTLEIIGLKTALGSSTYTIGSDTSDDYSSFSAAINDLNTFGICQPIFFLVDSGTYTEQITIGPISGASAINTITFQSATGDSTDVIIQYASIGSDNWTLGLNGAHYVIFKQMTIKATGTTNGNCIYITDGAEHNIFEGNIIQASSSNISYSAAIYTTNGTHQYNIFKNNIIQYGYTGIRFAGASSTILAKGNIFEGNIITDFSNYGVTFGNQDSLQFINNIIENSLNYIYAGLTVGHCNNIRIVGNKINVNGDTGMQIHNSDAIATNPSLIANNFINLTGTGTSTTYGFNSGNNDYLNFYHNSIKLDCGSSNSKSLSTSDGSNNNFINNIFVNTVGGYAFYASSTTGIAAADYNCLYSSGNYLARWGGNTANLAALQSSSGKFTNSISVEPIFNSPIDLHTNHLALKSKGTALIEVSNDIDGEARDTISPDLGADEFPTFYMHGHYTIGTSTSEDYASFSAAIIDLNLRGVDSAVVFDITTGIYNEKIEIPEIYGASASNTITFQSSSGDSTDVVLQETASAISANNYTILLNNADYIIIKDITIKRTGTTQAYGTIVELTNDANYNKLINCQIIGYDYSSAINPESRSLIYNNNTTNCDYNEFHNNFLQYGAYGIYYHGISTSSLENGTKFNNNVFNNQYFRGVDISYQNAPEFIGNKITNTSTYTSIQLSKFSYCMNGFIITHNNISKSNNGFDYGLYLLSCNGSSSNRGLVANNFISTSRVNSGNCYGISNNGSEYIDYYYNSVNIDGNNNFTFSRCIDIYSGGYINIKNNIFSNKISGYAFHANTLTAITISDYNCLYSSGNNLAYWNGNKTDLTALQTASNMFFNSISVLPPFIFPMDLHLTSPLNANALPIVEVIDDIDGEARNLTTPSMGADEFVLFPDNTGIVAIDFSNNCEGNTDVIVKLKSYGTDTLFTAIIKFTVNGGLHKTYNWTGSMNYGDTSNVTIDTLTTNSNSTYNFQAYTILPNGNNDPQNFNDTINSTKSFFSLPIVTLSQLSNICNKSNLTLTGGQPSGGYFSGFGINNGIFYSSIAGIGTHAINYIYTDTNNCTDSTSQTLEVYSLPIYNLGNDTSFCFNDSMSIHIPNYYNVVWNTGDSLNHIIIDTTASYYALLTDSNMCQNNTDTINVTTVIPYANQEICIVGVDSFINANFIVWEKALLQGISSFNLYKESTVTGIYNLLANIPFAQTSVFADTSSNPSVKPESYKISIIDSCGNESQLSPYHKTMHLTINQGIGNSWNLIWSQYQGFFVSSYRIWRGISPGTMNLLDSTSGTTFTYTDLNPPTGATYYLIEVIKPTPCIIGSKNLNVDYLQNKSAKINYNSSRSNTADNIVFIGIYEKNNTFVYKVYPNPNDGMFTVDINSYYENVPIAIGIEVYNLLGEKIYADEIQSFKGNYKHSLNLSTLPKGIYQIVVMNDKFRRVGKVVIQ